MFINMFLLGIIGALVGTAIAVFETSPKRQKVGVAIAIIGLTLLALSPVFPAI